VSKAFTWESDHADETPFLRRQIPPGIKNLITREGADRLRSKLEGLVQERQASVAGNHETIGGDQAQRQKLDSSIRDLQDVLSSVVIAELPVDRSKVGFGAAVVVSYTDGHQETFRIVGIDEADPERGSISWLSPLAKALLSKRPGDRVQFREEELKIVDLTY
jgi:transcription elongation factor GreB